MLTPNIPPQPRFRYPGAVLFAFRRDPLGLLTRLARDYGDVVALRLARQHLVLINHPDLIRDILVTHHRCFKKGRGLERVKRFLGEGLLTSEGEFHLRQRRMIQPAFHRQRIHGYGATMVAYAQRTAQRWQPGTTLDVAHEMMRLTLGVAGKTLFDADVEDEANEIGAALTELMHLFNVIASPLEEWLERLPLLPAARRFQRARDRLDRIVYRLIDERRRSGEDRGDLLSMLLQAQDIEGDGTGMSDQQIRDEAMTLLLAGHETTANALSWTWYLLSQHPEVEARFHAELDQVLQGRTPTADDVTHLPYTRMVFSEALRLYPPAWIIGRRALVDYQLRDYRLPAGTVVVMSQYVMHRDPRFYPDPQRFDPERWRPEQVEQRPKFAYFPFGGGPRLCIGEQFAWMEGVLVLATIGQRWRLRLAPGQTVEPEPLITLRPRAGLRMIVAPR